MGSSALRPPLAAPEGRRRPVRRPRPRSGRRVTDAPAPKSRTVAGPMNTTVLLLEDGDGSSLHYRVRFPRQFAEPFAVSSPKTWPLSRSAWTNRGFCSSRLTITASLNSRKGEISPPTRRTKNRPKQWPELKLMPVGERFLKTLKKRLRRLPGGAATGNRSLVRGRGRAASPTIARGAGPTGRPTSCARKIAAAWALIITAISIGKFRLSSFVPRTVLPVAALLQFTGHPVTSYHPEHPTVFGDWPAVAADLLGEKLGGRRLEPVPVAFLQGCAGDVNSKEMFCGGVAKATEFGRMLGESAVEVLDDLKCSKRDGMDYTVATVGVPLAPLAAGGDASRGGGRDEGLYPPGRRRRRRTPSPASD